MIQLLFKLFIYSISTLGNRLHFSLKGLYALWLIILVLAFPAVGLAKLSLPDNLNELEVKRLLPDKVHKHTLLEVIHHLKFSHYLQQQYQVDDTLSKWVLEHYIDKLDPNRSNLYQSDIDRLRAYENLLDDALRNGNLKPAFDIYNTYQQRTIDRLVFSIQFLEKSFGSLNFKSKDHLKKDRSEEPWPNTKIQMQDLWVKHIKAAILAIKLSENSDKDIQQTLIKRYKNRLNHLIQTTSEDVFQLFINTLTSLYDPHTQYLSPRASANFDINMSLSLEGIGAVLQNEEDYTKVVRLVPGGPADKSGELSPEDKIISVGQTKKELVDILGWKIGKVVELIRGPKGSNVFLEIRSGKKNAGRTRVIQIKRDTVQLEDRAAKSEVIWTNLSDTGNAEKNKVDAKIPIGVIQIPTFYADFKGQQAGKKNYRRTSSDVENLLHDLNKENIKGLIIDLRNNGGGSLQEANRVLGLFIKEGPTVQVRDSLNRIDLHRDRDPRITYNGPLIVLVNRLSASASEIFAGAIQDYQRGLIIGSRTFGKGTVQALRKLNHGHLKFTQLKFYRVSGASNQHLGIIPDIEFPSLYDLEEVGESAQENALPWDTIKPANFKLYSKVHDYTNKLERLHLSRIPKDPDFQFLKSQVDLFRKLNDRKTISLNESLRKKEFTENQNQQLAIENKRRKLKNLTPFKTINELEAFEEENKKSTQLDLVKEDDAELNEASQILVDLIQVTNSHIAGSYSNKSLVARPLANVPTMPR